MTAPRIPLAHIDDGPRFVVLKGGRHVVIDRLGIDIEGGAPG